MNKGQKDYAIKRINQIASRKIADVKSKFKQSVSLSSTQKARALRAGEFEWIIGSYVYASQELSELVKFDAEHVVDKKTKLQWKRRLRLLNWSR